MKIHLIIPCYNVRDYCGPVIRSALHYPVDIIAINDGSTDGTKEILEQLASENRDRIKLISFPENRGKGNALIEGFKAALPTSDILITFDGDGQHKTSSLPALIAAIEQGADMVIGCRDFTRMPLRSRLGNTITSWLLCLRYPHAPYDTQSGLRGFTSKFAQAILQDVQGGHYEMELHCLLLALRLKKRIETVPIPTIYLHKNRSSSFGKITDSIRILAVLFCDFFRETS